MNKHNPRKERVALKSNQSLQSEESRWVEEQGWEPGTLSHGVEAPSSEGTTSSLKDGIGCHFRETLHAALARPLKTRSSPSSSVVLYNKDYHRKRFVSELGPRKKQPIRQRALDVDIFMGQRSLNLTLDASNQKHVQF